MKIRKRTLFLISVVLISLFLLWKAYLNYNNKWTSVEDGLDEISGIEFDKAGNLWAINDSGNSTEIHQIDSTGHIKRSINIHNAKNIDWEDLTQDDFGHFFIGDFGNNDNERSDLTVYKIENPTDIREKETEAEIIRFKFTDQDLGNKNDSIKNLN